MPLRLAITKVSGIGEQIVADVCQWNPVTGDIVHDSTEEMLELFNATLDKVDSRMQEMNMRVIEASGFRQYCTHNEWSKILSILEFISGKQSLDIIVSRLRAAKEENEELERGRTAAANNLDPLNMRGYIETDAVSRNWVSEDDPS